MRRSAELATLKLMRKPAAGRKRPFTMLDRWDWTKDNVIIEPSLEKKPKTKKPAAVESRVLISGDQDPVNQNWLRIVRAVRRMKSGATLTMAEKKMLALAGWKVPSTKIPKAGHGRGMRKDR